MRPRHATTIPVLVLTASLAFAETTGLVPLTDLGSDPYHGFPGGLYPGGDDAPPQPHLDAALACATEIVPRDAAGNPAPAGFIAMIAVGMSNTTHEFAVFERDQDRNRARNARVVILDSGLGGQDASTIADPAASYWQVLDRRLAALELTPAQVQVAWLKEAEAGPPNDFPGHAIALREDLERIANNLHDRYPNLKLCYVSSRTYGGYATGSLNPEPQAYESGFSVKWLIEDQILGDPGLNHGQLASPVRAPLLLWGPYLWADGTKPRSDGLVWHRADFETDGTHPSPAGEQKVGNLLGAFFAADATAAAWWPARGDSLVTTIEVTDDAHVSAGDAAGNFGAAVQLVQVGSATPSNVYLAFDAATVARPVVMSKLSLRVVQGGGGRASLVPDAGFSETGITWSNAPAIGSAIVDMPQSSRDGTIGASVTDEFSADTDGRFAVALSALTGGQQTYWSGEGGQPPRLVLVVACPFDGDGDGLGDACDCAPADPSAFAVPDEIDGLRWVGSELLSWDAEAVLSGSGTRYEVMRGDLGGVSDLGPGPEDVCVAADIAETETTDPSPLPAADSGFFYLVRARNTCGASRWETATSGEDRATAPCQ